MGREFELKYRADGEILSAIQGKFGEFIPISMETAYYDTADGLLNELHWTLRRRYENGISVCTLKTPAPGGGRGEWEVLAPDIAAALPMLQKLDTPEKLKKLSADCLVLSCGARFTRLAKTVEIPGALVELALDRGVLLGGGRELPFAEMEAELKEGSEEALLAFGQSLAKGFSLEPEQRSKYARAKALAKQK